jgi:uncharacterized protein YjhX (UPF0386 family)
MDSAAFLTRVEAYHRDGWRLALINVTTVMAATAPVHGAAAAAVPTAEPTPSASPAAPSEAEAPGRFEIVWAFAKGGQFETIREEIVAGDEVPSISEFFGAAFLYENEIRELFGIQITGIGLDLKGQLYKTATKVPFSHAAVKARLAALAAAQVKP